MTFRERLKAIAAKFAEFVPHQGMTAALEALHEEVARLEDRISALEPQKAPSEPQTQPVQTVETSIGPSS